ncbi:hypothetical protein DVH05_027196 [Phytophthora capsici]|nr:hypothetical protein DVH05_027196 [Phytophthora capsici]
MEVHCRWANDWQVADRVHPLTQRAELFNIRLTKTVQLSADARQVSHCGLTIMTSSLPLRDWHVHFRVISDAKSVRVPFVRPQSTFEVSIGGTCTGVKHMVFVLHASILAMTSPDGIE